MFLGVFVLAMLCCASCVEISFITSAVCRLASAPEDSIPGGKMDLLHWLWSTPRPPCLSLRLLGHQVLYEHETFTHLHRAKPLTETFVPLCSASMFAVSFPLFIISATSAKPTPSRYVCVNNEVERQGKADYTQDSSFFSRQKQSPQHSAV